MLHFKEKKSHQNQKVIKCNNHQNWCLSKKLNQEYVQNHWVWYTDQICKLYGCEKNDLNHIKAHIYTTSETQLETTSYIYMRQQITNKRHLLASLTPIHT